MNLFFSKLGSYGRFGNCLFQISALMGMAKGKGEAFFPDWPYEQYFVEPLPHGEPPTDAVHVKEDQFNFKQYEFEDKDYDMLGYFQSERYFRHIEADIRKQFTLKPEVIERAKSHFQPHVWEKPTILMQVRRTDYVGCPHYYQLPVTYYIQALQSYFVAWQDTYNLIFISDDIPYCKVHFGCLSNAYFADVVDIEQIAIAGLCDHYIIANSSFGWWGAWLGEKTHSLVVHPGRLHAGKLLEKSDESDYWPARWINLKKDDYKLDLSDCTFTIPVFYDHVDRKKNLDLSVCMLMTSFNTNIIIGEQGSDKFKYMQQWCQYEKFDMKHFHRTKMLNDMAIMSDTPYIANWDCDVLIPPMQLWLTMLLLRSGDDMVFPYDGRFARLPRQEWFSQIEKFMDIGIIGDTEPKGRRGKPVPESSVGGAVFFNKESFIDGGMENEYMISFGPEDCERNDRFTTLGFKVTRCCSIQDDLGGCLYHINHFCGPNSSKQNPFFKANHAEIDKVRLMDRDTLRQYIDTWPWRHKYTEAYYRRIGEGAIRSAGIVYKWFDRTGISIDSVVDIGCGVGEWRGSDPYVEYVGVDHNIPKRCLLIPVENYKNIDLEKEVYESNVKFDIALCLEVAEHISIERAGILIEMLCSLSDQVLFSAAIPHQGGTGHINEQWQTWWAEKFAVHGFYANEVQPDIRDNENIELWYRQNIVLYVKGGTGKVHDYVHPKYYEQIVGYLKSVPQHAQQLVEV